MNDFREFSEQYNDYLMHKQYVKKKSSKSIPKEYATNPAGYVQFLRNHEHMTDDEIKDHIDYRIRYEGGSTMEFFYKCLAYLDNSNLKHGINDFRDVHEDYLMHSNGRPGKTVHKTFLYKGMTPQDYVDELLSSKTKEEAIQNLNNRLNNPPVSYNPQEKKFFIQCLKILQNK